MDASIYISNDYILIIGLFMLTLLPATIAVILMALKLHDVQEEDSLPQRKAVENVKTQRVFTGKGAVQSPEGLY